ncbi:hypothetical protein AI27_16410 [Sphingomonas sp. BHC-A]|uniref:Uncharacterized protein n=1 Tax=Sphingobium indicum (strain DSM 16412 / CCM 7286 / MTCC 6364 / B90A) TaxID=861109 RepID=A0A1L5BMF3_SPHIB|nr:hypothetical protein [Sphingobium indicum]APL94081.1 hypothetical protein SIDU_05945 [Sphingobium indicum B90A]KEZ00033.1 hypothetical protein AI27_16410 [Sphingomonas sp. BHC-A]
MTGRALKYAYYGIGGALAGWGLGYGIAPDSPSLQAVLAGAFGWLIAKANVAMDDDPTFPGREDVRGAWPRLRANAHFLSGGALGEAGALRMTFIALGVALIFWFARDATESIAYDWFGYDAQSFVEDRWPIVLASLVALLGAYRYLIAKDARKAPVSPP